MEETMTSVYYRDGGEELSTTIRVSSIARPWSTTTMKSLRAALLLSLAAASALPALADAAPMTSVAMGLSMKYDLAFCLYTLADVEIGRARYRDAYPGFLERFGSRLSPESRAALASLRELRSGGLLFGSSLATLFSRVEADDIAGLVSALEGDDPGLIAQVRSWGEGSEPVYRSMAPGLISILKDLALAGFEEYWRGEVAPELRRKIASLERSGLGNRDLSGAIARYSGKPARPIRVLLFPVHFMLGQGQQILPLREGYGASDMIYLADSAWSDADFELQLVHEAAHNQVLDWQDPAVRAMAEELGKDPYFQGVYQRQIAVSGYNSLDSFIEENVTEAVQMLIARDLGLGVNPVAYLRYHDGGSHVLSLALLKLVVEAPFAPSPGRGFGDFLIEQTASGSLGPGSIRRLSSAMLAR